MSYSFCNESQSSWLIDDVHSKKDKDSCQDLTNCWALTKCWKFKRIHSLSNVHHHSWILYFPCITTSCSINYCIIDIHGCSCWLLSHYNAKLRFVLLVLFIFSFSHFLFLLLYPYTTSLETILIMLLWNQHCYHPCPQRCHKTPKQITWLNRIRRIRPSTIIKQVARSRGSLSS